MTYEFRYSFDAGSGVCLWAKNDAAKERFGYAVAHWELPLSENTKKWLEYLVAWFDTSLDWQSPADVRGRWSDEELQRFTQAVGKGLEFLRSELPSSQYVFVDEANI